MHGKKNTYDRGIAIYMYITSGILILIIYITTLKFSNYVFPQFYSDERYYIHAGLQYLNGTHIDIVNWEHPPLAKYLIGFSALYLGNPHVLVFWIGYFTTFLFFLILLRVSGTNYYKAVIGILILCSEIPFIKIFNYALLDDFTLFFSSLAFYIAIKSLGNQQEKRKEYGRFHYSILEGVSWGAAIASKWTAVYLLLGRFITYLIEYFNYYKGALKSLLARMSALLVMTSTVYILSFFNDFSGSFSNFIIHNLRMINFMLVRHSITLHTFTKGLTLMFFKMTFWHRLPNVFITLTVINSTIVNQSITTRPAPFTIEVDILPTFGGLLLPLVPFALVYGILQFKRLDPLQRFTFVMAVASLFPVFHGSIPWYFAYATYFWCLFIVSIMRDEYLTVLLILNVAYYALMVDLGFNRLIITGV